MKELKLGKEWRGTFVSVPDEIICEGESTITISRKEKKMDNLLSRESAKEIEEWVERHDGYIERTRKHNIEICNINSFTTILLKNWIDMGVNVYFTNDRVNISNWPGETRKFEVEIMGDITREDLEMVIFERTERDAVSDVSVKEK